MAVVRKTATKTRTSSKTGAPTKKTSTRTAVSSRTRTTPTKPTKASGRATTPTRPTRAKKTTPTKPTRATSRAASTKVKEVAKPKKTTATRVRDVDPVTGFTVGTDSHTIAMELMKGGVDRSDVIDRLRKKLPETSNRGTPKPVANIVASVIGKMKDGGFTIESTWVMNPPTRASKAKATREKNKRLAARG